MKKIFLGLLVTSFAFIVNAQTLFTYGSNAVSKDEFLRAYNKNKTAVTDKSKALRDYLDLFIKFKLKVKAATDMHLDTLSTLKSDLQNFRSQIEEGYLTDDQEVSRLVQEAFIRSQKDIHILHLFIPVPTDAKGADSIKYSKAAQDAYAAAMQQKSFAQISDDLKKSSVKADWADAGFITVFTLPYNYENIVYQLKPGEISKPFSSKNGYHLFKNVEERKAAGKIKIAQILISVPVNSTEIEKLQAKKLADSVYQALKSGADFAEMARNVSNDKMTFITGGELPEFGVGKFTPAFENRAFAMQKDGEITAPFETEFGYHILKRLSQTPVPTDKNEAYAFNLKQQLQEDPRMQLARDKFLNDVLKKTHFKKNANLNMSDLFKLTDSFLVADKIKPVGAVNGNTVLFSFDNSTVKVSQWLDFIKEYKNTSGAYKGETDKQLFEKYISNSAFDNYRKRLQQFNPDFKYQLQEFKEGNMLFEVMERNVWSKAAGDTTELKKYFDREPNKYIWGESADAILVSAASERIAKEAAQQLKASKDWKQIVDDNNPQLQADSGRYELKQLPVDKIKIAEGFISDPVVNSADGTASFVKILKLYPANQPRNFEEARGLVINDYQNLLEEKWLQQLKKKYPVKINEQVFQSILR